jgi:hypothetical protein
MSEPSNRPTLASHGWALVSAEDRQSRHPTTFRIPSRAQRESLSPGDAAKLLFDIETRKHGAVIDRGVDRMWVIVKARDGGQYVGVLDSDPGRAENLRLHERDVIVFGPEHVADIDKPPREYIVRKYGPGFFGAAGAAQQ